MRICVYKLVLCVGILLTLTVAGLAQAPPDGSTERHRDPGGAFQIELFGATAFHLAASRAVLVTPTQTADSGARSILPEVGFAASSWFGKRKILGSFVDFSYLNGGSATASIGADSSQASSHLIDFHGGVQVQIPFHRVRPYACLGGGFAHISSKGSITLGGISSSFAGSTTGSSLIYGGGARVMVGSNWGIRSGVEGVTISSLGSGGRANYGRVVFGVFWSSK